MSKGLALRTENPYVSQRSKMDWLTAVGQRQFAPTSFIAPIRRLYRSGTSEKAT